MNKYQEALEIVKHYYVSNEAPKSIALLQELVDRATPKQPLNRYTYNTDGGEKVENGECPHCHKAMVRTMDIESSFCDHCGQSLEWEQGEKK